MTQNSPRLTTPRLWRNLAMASAAVGLSAAPLAAQLAPLQVTIPSLDQGARLWTVQAEGGEGGEAGAVAGASQEVAYLAQLSIVEGHLVAAAQLYRNGQVEDALGLSYHPEAEMMDAVRESTAAHGVADITPAMQAFSAALEAKAPMAEVEAALAAVSAAVAAAQAPEAADVKVRAEALARLVKAAASEYGGSIEDGKVSDVMAYQESHAFLEVARVLAVGLQKEAASEKAATRILDALKAADEAYGDIAKPEVEARDPAILLAVAARVELIASSVRQP